MKGSRRRSASDEFSPVIKGRKDPIYIFLNDNGHKVLFIKDSFGVPVSGWLACAVDQLYIVDLRFAQKKSVYDYIRDYGIDTVIVMYNAEMLPNRSLFDFSEISSGY